ncbi:lipopolysaccharide assembly protein LapA domain-containing protein [Phytohabitans sp. ZYX-F-186]|uniref:Lipopolysaccharide assembly protein LapA domain-containing protein n=1 Tax=Phytohabitans maris TaxID=3071409 RepID=A0ABU0ZI76_9ACTN|nr:lipopolysaccharide assembly protein LapA domain-containing protein [Phytohabitans sp. ZYX-F-186]MDQ7906231.1 lipopolysaccharide assembly protein LapA domain-containing protein [Phytohabitans sp. ZYX-F-186]
MGEPREGEAPPRPADTEPAEPPPKPGRSRAGGAWVGLVLGAVVLILLLIFVLQNLQDVRVSFISGDSTVPLGVALLLAAVAGALVVAVPGSARILQLRRAHRTARRALTRHS